MDDNPQEQKKYQIKYDKKGWPYVVGFFFLATTFNYLMDYTDSDWDIIEGFVLCMAYTIGIFLPVVLGIIFYFIYSAIKYKELRILSTAKLLYVMIPLELLAVSEHFMDTTDNQSEILEIEKKYKTLLNETEIIQAKRFYDKVIVNDTEIYLPRISGLRECYDEPRIKSYVDFFEMKENETLAFYADSVSREIVEDRTLERINNYFKVFISTEIPKDLKVNNSFINQLYLKYIDDSEQDEDVWKSSIDVIESRFKRVDLATPLSIETYQSHPSVVSTVSLMKEPNGGDQVFIAILTMANIKNELISWAYYLNFDDQESVEIAKNTSNSFTKKFLQINGMMK